MLLPSWIPGWHFKKITVANGGKITAVVDVLCVERAIGLSGSLRHIYDLSSCHSLQSSFYRLALRRWRVTVQSLIDLSRVNRKRIIHQDSRID